MSVEGVEWDSRIKRVSLFEKVTTKTQKIKVGLPCQHLGEE